MPILFLSLVPKSGYAVSLENILGKHAIQLIQQFLKLNPADRISGKTLVPLLLLV